MEFIEVEVQEDFLRRLAKTKPFVALCELIWNACDADSCRIDVDIRRNLISGIETIEISDNGTGIVRLPVHEFSQLGNSWKGMASHTRVRHRFLHGRSGQGRFKAFALGAKVCWDTQFYDGDKLKRYQIFGSFDNPKKFEITDYLAPINDTAGTTVTIRNVFDEASRFCDRISQHDFAKEFAIYLKNYPDILMRIDSHPIKLTEIISHSAKYALGPHYTSSGSAVSGSLDVVEWHHPIERSIYLCDADGVTRAERPAEIRAPGFDFTAYIQSSVIDHLARDNVLDMEMSAELNLLVDSARTCLSEHFRRREREVTASLIEQWKEDRIYPYQTEAATSAETTKRKVFDMVAVSVHQNLRGFEKTDNDTKALSFELIKEAIDTGPRALVRILDKVVKLPKSKIELFDKLLERTSLGSIIDFLNEVSDRISLIHVLETIIAKRDLRESTKEKEHLHRLVGENTWLFGEEFAITLNEIGLTNAVAELTGCKVDDSLGVVTRKDGRTGRLDILLPRIARRAVGDGDLHLVVELKRPSHPLNMKDYVQVQSYAQTLCQHRLFVNTNTRWRFWLVGGSISDDLRFQIESPDREMGCAHRFEKGEIWIKSWGQLIQSNLETMEFYRSRLDLAASQEQVRSRLSEIYQKVIPGSSASQQKDDLVDAK
jgi:histidine kinase/DNA gyrase B/HSP90-like ATPase